MWGFPTITGPVLGVPIVKTVVILAPDLGNYPVGLTEKDREPAMMGLGWLVGNGGSNCK